MAEPVREAEGDPVGEIVGFTEGLTDAQPEEVGESVALAVTDICPLDVMSDVRVTTTVRVTFGEAEIVTEPVSEVVTDGLGVPEGSAEKVMDGVTVGEEVFEMIDERLTDEQTDDDVVEETLVETEGETELVVVTVTEREYVGLAVNVCM
jgi:hypothetical protein